MHINKDSYIWKTLFASAILCSVLSACGTQEIIQEYPEEDLQEISSEISPEISSEISSEISLEIQEDSRILTRQDVFELQENIAEIRVGIHRASGVVFMLEEDAIILLSCKHILAFGDTAVTRRANEDYVGNILGTSALYDLGYIRVTRILEGTEDLMQEVEKPQDMSELQGESGLPEVGDPVWIVSSDMSSSEDVLQGFVTQIDVAIEQFGGSMILVDCIVQEGMSGSAVLSGDGKLIGIVAGGNETETVVIPYAQLVEGYEEVIGSNE